MVIPGVTIRDRLRVLRPNDPDSYYASRAACGGGGTGCRARYLPDFVVLVDDGRGDDDLLRLVVEVKGYRGEDAKDKKTTMDTYWVPGVNNLGAYGRWAFAELTDVYTMEDDFEEALKTQFQASVERAVT